MPRRHNYADSRSTWSPEQLVRMEELIDEADRSHTIVPWREHLLELGHPLTSVRTMASRVRARRIAARDRAHNRMIRNIADTAAINQRDIKSAAPVTQVVLKETSAKPADIADHMRCTSTQRMSVMAEIHAKIVTHGTITGGIFGDPLPGRSALDEKRGTAVAPSVASSDESGTQRRRPAMVGTTNR